MSYILGMNQELRGDLYCTSVSRPEKSPNKKKNVVFYDSIICIKQLFYMYGRLDPLHRVSDSKAYYWDTQLFYGRQINLTDKTKRT